MPSAPNVELFDVGDAERAAASGSDRLAVASGDAASPRRPPRPGLVGLAYRLRSGGLARHRRARMRRCIRALVRVPEGTEWNVDGELVTAGTSHFRGETRAFCLIVT